MGMDVFGKMNQLQTSRQRLLLDRANWLRDRIRKRMDPPKIQAGLHAYLRHTEEQMRKGD